MVTATVVVSLTVSVVSSFPLVAVSVVVSFAVSEVASATGERAELDAAMLPVPEALVVTELGAAVLLGPDAAVVVTEPETVMEVPGIFVVAGAGVMAALADNEVAAALVAPVPRVVEVVTVVAPTLVEVVAAAVVAAIAGELVPVFAKIVEAA